MKRIMPPHYLFIFLTIFFVSCSNENFEELVPDATGTDGENPNPDPDTPDNTATTPCDFDLSKIAAGETKIINCILDLKGETVNLPENVTLDFDKGDIINGKIVFANGGKIAGQLLSSKLTVEGSVTLIDPTFKFYASRWDVIEGSVDIEIAKKNSINIKKLISYIPSIDGSTFEIDKLDAFFHGDGGLNYNIEMPSNFHLKMTDKTHLRTFPSLDEYSTFLIVIENAENVKVTGGHLHGDRDLYDRRNKLPLSHTMKINTGNNVLIEGVHMSNATEDGLAIENYRFTFDPKYVGSKNIRINKCVFDSNRRINLTITDGQHITIENSTFIDGGIDTDRSDARAPSCNLNIEPHRERNDAGELVEYQRVSHVYIKNNKQLVRDNDKNPNAGGFLLSHGNGPIIVENNEMIEAGVSFHTVDGVIIRNNTITNGGIIAGSPETFGRTDFVFGNEVYGNNVKHTKTALNIGGNGVIARDNILEGTVGIALGAGSTDSSKGLSNSKIFNNKIKASSRGITSMNTFQNVTIENNTLEMLSGANWSFALGNKWSQSTEANFIVTNNTVTGVKTASDSGAPPSLIGANSISVTNNTFGDVQINGGSNINVTDNEIDSNIGAHGILFYANPPNSTFTRNNIKLYTSETPLRVQCIKPSDGIELSSSVNTENNICNEL